MSCKPSRIVFYISLATLRLLLLLSTVAAFYTPIDNTHPLVICDSLNADMQTLLQTATPDLIFPNALAETRCVAVNVCSEQNHRGEPVPANTWLHRSLPALTFDNEFDGNMSSTSSELYTESYNHYSVDYARVPEGVILRSCPLDFDHLRRTGEYVCDARNPNATAIVVGTCPMSANNPEVELLSCLEPLQYDVSSAPLNGHAVWGDITYPVATEQGSMQMVYYEFEPDFGCFDATDTTAGITLTSTLSPNRVVSCPELDVGTYTDQCQISCPNDYELKSVNDSIKCVHKCNEATTTCETGFYATSTCLAASQVSYICEACAPVQGHYFLPWTTSNPSLCLSEPCAAGTFEMDSTCHPCARDTYNANAGKTNCSQCDFGAYALPQATSCTVCFSEDISTLGDVACAPGQFFTRNLTDIEDYFSTKAINYQEHKNLSAYCHQSYTCLPCPPGTFALLGSCQLCAIGRYQPNFQKTGCFDCGEGLTTKFNGSYASSQCVCDKGLE